MITRIVKLTFKRDKIKDFLQIWEESKEKIAAQAGCHRVEMLRSIDEPNICFTYSHWEDLTALNNYRKSALFEATWKKTKALFDDKAEAWSTESQGYALQRPPYSR